jgi:hypothetical protein
VLDSRGNAGALDHFQTRELHDRLNVRRPQLQPLPPRRGGERRDAADLGRVGPRGRDQAMLV